MHIGQIILAMLGTTSFVCLSVCTFLIWGKDPRTYYLAVRSELSFTQKTFLAFFAIGLMVSIYTGINAMLFWIPDSIGSVDGDGDYRPLRTSLAGVFSIGVGMMLLAVLERGIKESFLLIENLDRVKLYEDIFVTSLDIDKVKSLKSKLENKLKKLESAIKWKHELYLKTDNAPPYPERRIICMYKETINLLEKHQMELSQLKDEETDTATDFE
jgi:hypothetical protein